MNESSTPPPPGRRTPIALLVAIALCLVVAIGAGVAVAVGAASGAFSSSPAEPAAPASGSGSRSTPGSDSGPGSAPVTVPTAAPATSAPSTGSGMSPLTALVDPDWATRTAALTGIPVRALLAYAGAEIRMRADQPACGLSWNTLAAIGQVESEHGTLSGGLIQTDGRAHPPVIGIALDGQGVEAIADTDRGVLDGDTVWDRAVGPMQFLPSTWADFGVDGDGDGTADVQSIDDAALTAGRYLCADGRDLTSDGDWIAAVHSYNGTVDYNNRVAGVAEVYADAVAAG